MKSAQTRKALLESSSQKSSPSPEAERQFELLTTTVPHEALPRPSEGKPSQAIRVAPWKLATHHHTINVDFNCIVPAGNPCRKDFASFCNPFGFPVVSKHDDQYYYPPD